MASWWYEQAARWPHLSPAQEIHLGQQVRAWLDHPPPAPAAVERRGKRARDRFVQSNLRLVLNVAERYRSVPSQYQDDLIQAGNLGLIRGVEKFDPARGYKFSTYAFWWIRQGIHSFLGRDGRTIRLPTTHSAQLTKVHAAILDLSSELNRHPSRFELSQRLGWSQETIERIVTRPAATLSLDAKSRLCDDASVSEAIPDPAAGLLDQIASADQLELVLAAIAHLEPCAQRVVTDQFLSPVPSTLQELARREGVDRSTVRAIISRSLPILRVLLEGRPLSSVVASEDPVEYGPQLGLPWAQ